VLTRTTALPNQANLRLDTLKNITFGVYDDANTVHYGSLGLGFGKGVNSNQSNVVDELVSQGVTKAKAFGLALGTNDGPNEGSLTLGGVDSKKFSGALQRVPIIDPPKYPFKYSEYRYYCVNLKLNLS
jgi:hypothetical protein